MPTANTPAIEKTLTRRLRSDFSAQEVKALGKSIARMQASGLKIDDVFPIGIVVQPDGVSIRGHMSPADVKRLGDLLPDIVGIRDLRVFPRGIIVPDTFRVHVNIGR